MSNADSNESKELKHIVGQIDVFEDSTASDTSMSVFTADGEEYVITSRKVVKRLLRYAGEEIDIDFHGYVRHDAISGLDILSVVSFKPTVADDDAPEADAGALDFGDDQPRKRKKKVIAHALDDDNVNEDDFNQAEGFDTIIVHDDNLPELPLDDDEDFPLDDTDLDLDDLDLSELDALLSGAPADDEDSPTGQTAKAASRAIPSPKTATPAASAGLPTTPRAEASATGQRPHEVIPTSGPTTVPANGAKPKTSRPANQPATSTEPSGPKAPPAKTTGKTRPSGKKQTSASRVMTATKPSSGKAKVAPQAPAKLAANASRERSKTPKSSGKATAKAKAGTAATRDKDITPEKPMAPSPAAKAPAKPPAKPPAKTRGGISPGQPSAKRPPVKSAAKTQAKTLLKEHGNAPAAKPQEPVKAKAAATAVKTKTPTKPHHAKPKAATQAMAPGHPGKDLSQPPPARPSRKRPATGPANHRQAKRPKA